MLKIAVATGIALSLGAGGTIVALSSRPAIALNENHYNRAWCSAHGGRAEVTLPSGARADCLTAEFAVEADWSGKWAEAIGQSLHYAEETGLRPAILFLVWEESRPAELYRLESTIDHWQLDITVFVVDAPRRN